MGCEGSLSHPLPALASAPTQQAMQRRNDRCECIPSFAQRWTVETGWLGIWQSPANPSTLPAFSASAPRDSMAIGGGGQIGGLSSADAAEAARG
jgi:hypothetical protein